MPEELHEGPITGRGYVVIGTEPEVAAIRQRSPGRQPVSNRRGVPFLAADVEALRPDEPAVIDGSTPGYPVESLAGLPAGDYDADLVGKLHFICGDMDNEDSNHPAYRIEEILEATDSPCYGKSFPYGRPNKGRGWTPITKVELIEEMAAHLTRHAPSGADTREWKY